ncbi:MAG: type II toxin-antitoxin system VapC family toxin [Pseudomonadales bacterium]|jgi:predicted nucleic acid-binding protein|nr:type II toxin-antitoxin system VapC family toxin [Pseudomonadales bacterium]
MAVRANFPADHRLVVIDASAALKWILDEEGRTAALELLDEDALHAPDFLLAEVANVLWSKARRRILDRGQADAAYEAIASVPVAYTSVAELTVPARILAHALDLTVYDALYVALAQRQRCSLATADARLAGTVDASGISEPARLIR